MMKKRRKFGRFFVGLICAGMLWAGGLDFSAMTDAFGQNVFQSYTKPQAAPDFSLSDLQGKQVNIREYRGQAIVLNFWATW